MDTKRKLMNAALKMFALKGYEAVSVRDVTKSIDRRETCLYNYFRNKKALMDSLAAEFEQGAKENIKQLMSELKREQAVDRARFLELAKGFAEGYLANYGFVQFARLMLIEQAASEEMRRMYTNYLYIIPLMYMSELFNKAGRAGEHSVDFLSTAFYGVALLYFQKHMMCGKSVKSMREAFLHELMPHIEEFTELYIV